MAKKKIKVKNSEILKLGIALNSFDNTFSRFLGDKYLKVKSFGFDAVDYSAANTKSILYTMSDTELGRQDTDRIKIRIRYSLKEKSCAEIVRTAFDFYTSSDERYCSRWKGIFSLSVLR